MTIKNILCTVAITAIFAANHMYTSEESTHNEQLRDIWGRYADRPQDPDKTPTTPDIIEHQPSMFKGRQQFFERKRIYFGTDQSGKACYASIQEHAKKNSAFGTIKLVIFQGNSKLKFVSPFKIIGTYSDINKHQPLKNSIKEYGGVWCPEQNAIIAGTRDKNICKAFAEFEKGHSTQSHSKILKK